MKKEYKAMIGIGGVLGVAAIVTGVLYSRAQRKKEIGTLLNNIDKGTGQFGDLRDFGIPGAAFDRKLWMNNPGCVSIGDWETVSKIAKKIWNAVTVVPIIGYDMTDAGIIITEFNKFKNVCDVSILSDAFEEKYKMDFNDFISRHISSDNAAKLKVIVQGLEPSNKVYQNSPMAGQGIKKPGSTAGGQL